MQIGNVGKSNFTKAVKALLNRIYDDTKVADSLFEQAMQWFNGAAERDQQQAEREQQVFLFQSRQAQANKGDQALIERNLQQAQSEQEFFNKQLQQDKLNRYESLRRLCLDILTLSESDSFEETNIQSAKMLGTIQLMSPTAGKNIAPSNQKSKHLYKALLSIRLLDRLLLDNQISHPFILQRFQAAAGTAAADEYQPFRDDVQVPLLMAALLQDIGSCHPDAQRILKGSAGDLDEFRVLENDERTELLKISYRESLNFVVQAIGIGSYQGNSKEQRDRYLQNEREKQAFLIFMLKNAIKPEQGVGNLLKIPQIYTSVVLSTKANYSYESLPKVGLVLEKGVEKGVYSPVAVSGLLKITGVFPQGFGITYIPKDSDRQDLDRYEYAIVTGLYPQDPKMPICRMVTRNLTYNVSAQGCVVSVENNLYYPHARKKLERISEERLLEILSKLVSNLEERKSMALLPKCWHPGEYFTFSKNQNLWNKALINQN
ncbi:MULTISPECIES: hypothetical protein [unclassified Arsukibacterium]|uniref:hypothetical protein n=1 Tax=unclassified Arsukibacterium TaxID=2635278 RepID=UPI000C65ACA6|nr:MULTISPECIES: hypothetical protein [unclassified Arsukibacterium]MBM33255.1 hypothetical protein [Rheinheimera sp.]|tara:strand:+ start:17113 stop:18579 length:1467 start_codon:yes stop_codon:yes gene_type:complete